MGRDGKRRNTLKVLASIFFSSGIFDVGVTFSGASSLKSAEHSPRKSYTSCVDGDGRTRDDFSLTIIH